MRVRSRRALAAAATLALLPLTLGTVGPTASPAFAVDGTDCTQVNNPENDENADPATDPSEPLVELGIAQAQAQVETATGEVPGAGVVVALVDSGVSPLAPVPADSAFPNEPLTKASNQIATYHGTAMASVIAGPEQEDVGTVGIAPGARILDARFYDAEDDNDGEYTEQSATNLVSALRRLVPLAGTGSRDVRIVNVSAGVHPDSAALRLVVERLTAKGAIVVAATGNRPAEAQEGDAPAPEDAESDEPGPYEPGEDYADYYFPAGYAKRDANPLVVAAGSVVPPELASNPPVLLSSAIDVVVPTYGAVAYSVDGLPCSFLAPSTSVAAAQVSGILAMLMTAFPDDTPRQTIARLETTATGSQSTDPSGVDRQIGRGIAQPMAALTTPLALRPDGRPVETGQRAQRAEPAQLPTDPPDLLADTRSDALWWGLVGGAALAVALIARPVLARRRRE